MAGVHLLAGISGCQNKNFLYDSKIVEKEVIRLVNESGLSVLHAYFHQFQEGDKQMGFTGVIVLAESHVTIHTWPEQKDGYADLDVFVCNYLTDNSQKAEKLFDGLMELFLPAEKDIKRIER